ncbi:major capsid protein [Phascolarctobacterium sp.]|uniref:major capsid protein n=1 Tax=Phascolarctobacterium sp. TaxID=2049039 RepID=UPI0038652CEE
MAITSIADMQLVPNKFTEYTIQRTTEKSALVRSGITVADPRVGQLINGTPKGGNLIQMPFYKPLTGEDKVFGEDVLTADGIETGSEFATLLIRQNAWGDTDLSKVFGGSDPMAAIGDLVADWWVIREQAMMMSILKGLFAENGALKAHLLDVSAGGTDNTIGVDTTLTAKQLMGDAADKLGVVFMHSATYTSLQKKNQITTEYSSDLKVKIDYYLGYEVIVDDGMPVNSGVYDTFFIGKGAFSRNDGMPQGLVGYEIDRDKLAATNYLINRRALVLHPLGVSWNAQATLAKKYANNNELATAANWQLVADHKKVPIVCLRHKI